ncbi:hypothetical protein LJC72_09345 [Bacteroides sp. OttesenSCG-928-D19]|nr:hypothetical protein [Bacteroides sp. OttesenSCG-928-N06]MDL2305526.1 hypothetical protein [Bacteroides sp. OttesenSCG-928-D19]
MKELILFLLLAIATTARGQESKTTNNPYTSDLNIFIQYLEETHPDPYTAFGGKVNFKHEAQTLRSKMEQVTDIHQFREMLTEFIAKLEDGHTFITPAGATNNQEIEKYLPLVFKIATDALFIESASKEYLPYIGSKLLAVNNIPVDVLLHEIRRFGSIENQYGAMFNLCNRLANQKNAQKLLGETSVIELTLQNTKDEIYNLSVNYTEYPDWAHYESTITIDRDNELLYCKIMEKENVAYLAWNSVVAREVIEDINPDNPQFENMINWAYSAMRKKRPENNNEAIDNIPELYGTFFSLLKEMKSKKMEYLIIDLRKNSGGMTPLCMPLLYMLYGNDYLNYHSDAQYNRLLSPLLLKKWNLSSIEDYNKSNGSDYSVGDYTFGKLFSTFPTTYHNGIGKQYTENLHGIPVYKPHVIVLCSPQTFSAAYHFIYYLTEIGHATVVGVPSRQAGNSFMETTAFKLPHTKIEGSISNSVQLMFPGNAEKGKVFMPDFPMMWKDYAKYNFDRNVEILYSIDLINSGKIVPWKSAP